MTVLRDWSCILLWLNIESYHELYIYDMQDGVCINLAAFFSLIQSLRDKIQRASLPCSCIESFVLQLVVNWVFESETVADLQLSDN